MSSRHPQRPAAVTAPVSRDAAAPAPAAVNPSGGASLEGATPELVEGAKQEAAPPETGAEASASGATGTDRGRPAPRVPCPVEDGAATPVPGDGSEEQPPATGSDAGDERRDRRRDRAATRGRQQGRDGQQGRHSEHGRAPA